MDDSLDAVQHNLITYGYPLVIFLGIAINLMAFIVFSRKKLQNTFYKTYFRAAAIFDSLMLCLLPLYSFLQIQFAIDMTENSVGCIIFSFLQLFAPAVSAWLVVIISLDRMLSISFPTQILWKNKISMQCIILGVLILSQLALYSPVLFYTKLIETVFVDPSTNLTQIFHGCTSTGVLNDVISQNLISTRIKFTFFAIRTHAYIHNPNNYSSICISRKSPKIIAITKRNEILYRFNFIVFVVFSFKFPLCFLFYFIFLF